MKTTLTTQDIADLIDAKMRSMRLKNSELEQFTGVDQSQISRYRRALFKRTNNTNLHKLCTYLKLNLIFTQNGLRSNSQVDPINNEDLISALSEVWDGTPAHARKLAKAIRLLGEIC
ncbi:MAG: helix-turn-helix transcriptional regulator [Candidatus Thiodiazotropha sp.]